MPAAADNYEDLHRLVDEFTPAEADAVRALVLAFKTGQNASPASMRPTLTRGRRLGSEPSRPASLT